MTSEDLAEALKKLKSIKNDIDRVPETEKVDTICI